MKNIPKPPLARVINEGVFNSSGLCPRCNSTAVRLPWIFGKRYCINKECYHHFKPIFSNTWKYENN
jgi:hypothetical protein